MNDARSKDALAVILHRLITDHIPAGLVEEIIHDVEMMEINAYVFDDVNLGRYVISLANRIHEMNRENDEEAPSVGHTLS